MYGKAAVYVFIAVIIGLFAYCYTTLPQTSSITNPIDANNEYSDYKLLENTIIESKSANIVSYRVIGQIEEITNDELKIRTLERIVTIKKPEATEYVAFVPPVLVDESKLQKNDYVRATVDVDKTTNEVVKLSVIVIGEYDTQEGEFKRAIGTSD